MCSVVRRVQDSEKREREEIVVEGEGEVGEGEQVGRLEEGGDVVLESESS